VIEGSLVVEWGFVVDSLPDCIIMVCRVMWSFCMIISSLVGGI